MEADITKKFSNKLLDREEVSAVITFDATTPNRKQVKESVCGKMGANPENAVMRRMETEFGKKTASVLLHVYETKDALMKNEPRYMLIREGLATKEDKKAAPAPKKDEKK
ncbi:MAG: 30S ribosomal protein S24e [Candidatus Bilamarchaeaceae archaeon]